MKTLIERSKAVLNVYLLLKNEDRILLSLRKNTGYFDDFYSFVAGHVEEAESAIDAAIRESQEEVGIQIDPAHLVLKGVMHRKTDRNNIDLFFECSQWEGQISNKEPEKCGGLQFFSLDALPENTIPYIKDSLNHNSSDRFYIEQGW